jgi:hypothetical protein
MLITKKSKPEIGAIMFQKNVGSTDKVVRLVLAVVLVALAVTGTLTGTWMYVAYVGALVLVMTSLFSFCGLYAIFGMNTCKVPEKS